MTLKGLVTAFLLATSPVLFAVESKFPAYLTYDDLPLLNTDTATLFQQLGAGEIFHPPGEVIQPSEICYSDKNGVTVNFLIESYPNQGAAKPVVMGIVITPTNLFQENIDKAFRRSAPCDIPEKALSPCMGNLCLGDNFEKAQNEFAGFAGDDSSNIDGWNIEISDHSVRLSDKDLAIRNCCSTNPVDFREYTFPSQEIRIQRGTDGQIKSLQVHIRIDFI